MIKLFNCDRALVINFITKIQISKYPYAKRLKIWKQIGILKLISHRYIFIHFSDCVISFYPSYRVNYLPTCSSFDSSSRLTRRSISSTTVYDSHGIMRNATLWLKRSNCIHKGNIPLMNHTRLLRPSATGETVLLYNVIFAWLGILV